MAKWKVGIKGKAVVAATCPVVIEAESADEARSIVQAVVEALSQVNGEMAGKSFDEGDDILDRIATQVEALSPDDPNDGEFLKDEGVYQIFDLKVTTLNVEPYGA